MNCNMCKNPACAQRGIDFKKQRCDGFIAITNADRIREWSDEEIAEFTIGIMDGAFELFTGVKMPGEKRKAMKEGWLDWLRQEVTK